jgi:hypothetical protein
MWPCHVSWRSAYVHVLLIVYSAACAVMCLQRRYCCIARYDALYAVAGRQCFQLPCAATVAFWICCCSGVSIAASSSIAALGSVLQIRAQLPQYYVVALPYLCFATATVSLVSHNCACTVQIYMTAKSVLAAAAAMRTIGLLIVL